MLASIEFIQKRDPTPNLGQIFPDLNGANHLICVNLRPSAVRLRFSPLFASIRVHSRFLSIRG